ncbi:type II secretion system F family protein [Desulfovibrio sp. JC022]|uniref:type II secretion system F family protein n=1 Tax=Desulfovibrio sp. JC022 TaxID=2593642 RepID=UPI0013D752BF|nr:type II secretion system F family protein [Desulfovibrio sp. JC022]NDV22280.1 type II secretion system F family protein [Desulfovibrio sp. JC022]
MATFTYTALKDGKQLSGEMEAADVTAVQRELSGQGARVLRVERKDGGPEEEQKGSVKSQSLFGKRISYKQVTSFTRQFATLLGSSLPLVRALSFLQDQNAGTVLGEVIGTINSRVREGMPLSRALSEYPKHFDTLYVSLVAAGETGGMLDKAMDRLAFMREAQEDLRSKVSGAMIYPAIMFIAMVGAIITMMLLVVPRFAQMFSSMGQKLPVATRVLIGISDTLQQTWWLFPLFLVVVIPAWKKIGSTPAGRMRIDTAKLKLPALGPIVIQVSMARWCRTLGTLIGSGVPFLSALQSSAGVTGNVAVSKVVEKATAEVREGSKLATPLKESGVIPAYVTEMISMGEESGSLDTMLGKIAEHYEREVDQLVKNLTSLLEPVMILVMGAVVGFIVMAILLPVFQMQLMAG